MKHPLRHDNSIAGRKCSTTNVTADIGKLIPSGQLNGTLGSVSAVELGSEVFAGLINDIDPSGFGEVPIDYMLIGGVGQILQAKGCWKLN